MAGHEMVLPRRTKQGGVRRRKPVCHGLGLPIVRGAGSRLDGAYLAVALSAHCSRRAVSAFSAAISAASVSRLPWYPRMVPLSAETDAFKFARTPRQEATASR